MGQLAGREARQGNEPASAIEPLRRDLTRAVDKIRADLDRIELLSVAMSAFAKPVPDYEPGFRHLRHVTAGAIELNRR